MEKRKKEHCRIFFFLVFFLGVGHQSIPSISIVNYFSEKKRKKKKKN